MQNQKLQLIYKNNKIQIKLCNQFIIVYFNNSIFLKQPYLKNESIDYNFFLVLLVLNRFGLIRLKKNKN